MSDESLTTFINDLPKEIIVVWHLCAHFATRLVIIAKANQTQRISGMIRDSLVDHPVFFRVDIPVGNHLFILLRHAFTEVVLFEGVFG